MEVETMPKNEIAFEPDRNPAHGQRAASRGRKWVLVTAHCVLYRKDLESADSQRFDRRNDHDQVE
ncbi:hypothetical protein GCM10007927_14880 [Sulfitobacter pacificus]|uniref:Uncharacterized protein n=1 Tax=Sulfitobacter pacificus TaxID=1499314 RepID=A0ABQ5VHY1_9RHOB|nr:hypothetical protein GCM10007927_14880 [Sulfitobacter pacificus]